MKTLQRLYLRDFLFMLFTITFALSGLFSLVSLVERMDELLPLGLKTGELIAVGVGRFPQFFSYLLPMATLISSILVLSLASRRNELTVIKAAGKNLRGFFLPFLLTALLLVPVNFLISEAVSPGLMEKSEGIIDSHREMNDGVSLRHGDLWIRAKGGRILHSKGVLPEGDQILGVSVFFMKDGRLSRRIEAENGSWSGNGLRLESARIYDLKRKRVSTRTELYLQEFEKPPRLKNGGPGIYEMGAGDLYKYYMKLQAMGYHNRKLLVDIHSRYAYPITVLFMMITGIVLSLRSRHGKGILSAGVGVLISIAYWFIFTLSLSFGYSGMLPPVVAGWSVPVISSIGIVIVYLRMPL
jgi:lipopolysaccharide export system permease protein